MPEIAEVELVAQEMKQLIGQTIKQTKIYDPKINSLNKTKNKKCVDIIRHGKLLAIVLEDNTLISFHLRMTGNILLNNTEQKHVRAKIFFDKDTISFKDPRRFGTIKIETKETFAKELGVDLFTKTKKEYENAIKQCAKTSKAAKTLMLDQKGPLAGAGNYLCDESLWKAKIHPTQKNLTEKQWRKIWDSCHEKALETLEQGGVSLKDYVKTDGSRGQGQNTLKVYGRKGKPCFNCQTPLEKIVVSGRGTTFCPNCQKET